MFLVCFCLIGWVHGALLAIFEDGAGTANPVPVGRLAVQQVLNDIAGTPGIWPLGAVRPPRGKPRNSAVSVAGVLRKISTAASYWYSMRASFWCL